MRITLIRKIKWKEVDWYLWIMMLLSPIILAGFLLLMGAIGAGIFDTF